LNDQHWSPVLPLTRAQQPVERHAELKAGRQPFDVLSAVAEDCWTTSAEWEMKVVEAWSVALTKQVLSKQHCLDVWQVVAEELCLKPVQAQAQAQAS
jgi:hypothetical protein